VAAGDVDGDGWCDCISASGRAKCAYEIWELEIQDMRRLRAWLGRQASTGAVFADVNGDGAWICSSTRWAGAHGFF
jgi:hypothetical protein